MNADTITVANGLAEKRSRVATGDDSSIRQFLGMRILYKGSSASALIKTSGNNAILSLIGASGSEAADPAFTYPSGGTPGTLSLNAGGFSTMGEVVDFINALPGYSSRLIGLRRSDPCSTTGALVADSTGQQAKSTNGAPLIVDTSVAGHMTAEISCLDGLMNKSPADTDMKRIAVNALHLVAMTLQHTAGVFEVISVNDFDKVDEVIYSRLIAVQFPVNASSVDFTNGSGIGINARPGRRLLVRARGAVVVTNMNVVGSQKILN